MNTNSCIMITVCFIAFTVVCAKDAAEVKNLLEMEQDFEKKYEPFHYWLGKIGTLDFIISTGLWIARTVLGFVVDVDPVA